MSLKELRRRERYRELIHQLNERYYQEYLRAERYRAEADWARKIRSTWLFRALRWLKHVWISPRPTTPFLQDALMPLAMTPVAVTGRVSIVIPFRDQYELLRDCLRSIRLSSWRNHEVILVDNGSEDPRLLRWLARLSHKRRYRIVSRPEPFNFARLCNVGAEQANGEHLLFLNNDTCVLSPDWLEQMLQVALQPEVGIVGASLFYPDGAIQHVGATRRTDGVWEHLYRGERPETIDHLDLLSRPCVVEAVTGACLLIGRELFTQLGGFDERLPVVYNDMDLCCRARDLGRKVALAPDARLLHYESLSRGYGD